MSRNRAPGRPHFMPRSRSIAKWHHRSYISLLKSSQLLSWFRRA